MLQDLGMYNITLMRIIFHPFYYSNEKMILTKAKYVSYEVLAIIKTLKRFRVYLFRITQSRLLCFYADNE